MSSNIIILELPPSLYHLFLFELDIKNKNIKNIKNFLIKELPNQIDNFAIQIVDAKLISGINHIKFAAMQTLLAKSKIQNVSLRFITLISLEKQITKAISKLNLKSETALICIISKNKEKTLKQIMDYTNVLDVTPTLKISVNESTERLNNLQSFYGVNQNEFLSINKEINLNSLASVLAERMAIIANNI